MEKVVVVVVVTIRPGSLGSAALLDWENLREPRLDAASSLKEGVRMADRVVAWDALTYVVKLLGYDLKK